MLPLHGVRVLLVDDDDDGRALLSLALEEAGAEVRSACDAKEAVRTMLQWPPTVVVSDLAMPTTDGFTLLREVRSMHSLRHVPAVAVSGMMTEWDGEAALAAGFQEHIPKPIAPATLVEAVKRWAHVRVASEPQAFLDGERPSPAP